MCNQESIDDVAEIIASLPNEMLVIIQNQIDPVSWYRFTIASKMILGRLENMRVRIPNWLVYDDMNIQLAYPKFWDAVVHQMSLAKWPAIAPALMHCSNRKNRIVLQWHKKPVGLHKKDNIDNYTVYFTSCQRYRAIWHVCYDMQPVACGLCTCSKSMRKASTRYVNYDVVMG
jgi:hypothetical protein